MRRLEIEDRELISDLGWEQVSVLKASARYAEALEEARKLHLFARETYGEGHYAAAWPRIFQGQALVGLGRMDEADPLIADGVADVLNWLGADHPQAQWVRINLGWLRMEQGRLEEARGILEDAIARCVALECDEWRLSYLRRWLGECYQRLGRTAEAIVLMQEAQQGLERTVGPDEVSRLEVVLVMAEALLDSGRLADAVSSLSSVSAVALQRLGRDHPVRADHLRVQGLVWRSEGAVDKARAALAEAVRIYELRSGPDHWRTRRVRSDLIHDAS